MRCRLSHDRSLDLSSARSHGIERFVERMLHFTDQLRRLRVDYYEYVSMKVIVLLTSGKSQKLCLKSSACNRASANESNRKGRRNLKAAETPTRSFICSSFLR